MGFSTNPKDVEEIEKLLPNMPFDKGMATVRSLANAEYVVSGSIDPIRDMRRAAIVHAAQNHRELERHRLHPQFDWKLRIPTIGALIRMLLKILRG